MSTEKPSSDDCPCEYSTGSLNCPPGHKQAYEAFHAPGEADPAQGEPDIGFTTLNIVNQLGDLWEVPVYLRQATNDQADAFVAKLVSRRVEAELEWVTRVADSEGRVWVETIRSRINALKGGPSD